MTVSRSNIVTSRARPPLDPKTTLILFSPAAKVCFHVFRDFAAWTISSARRPTYLASWIPIATPSSLSETAATISASLSSVIAIFFPSLLAPEIFSASLLNFSCEGLARIFLPPCESTERIAAISFCNVREETFSSCRLLI